MLCNARDLFTWLKTFRRFTELLTLRLLWNLCQQRRKKLELFLSNVNKACKLMNYYNDRAQKNSGDFNSLKWLAVADEGTDNVYNWILWFIITREKEREQELEMPSGPIIFFAIGPFRFYVLQMFFFFFFFFFSSFVCYSFSCVGY